VALILSGASLGSIASEAEETEDAHATA
jgi:hypothetical protein